MNLELRFVDSLKSVDEGQWQSLLDTEQPFCSYSFLRAMESSQSLATDKGWTASHALAYRGSILVAAIPSYIKTNSHGEFVFDWAWADAYEQCGLPYYPKLLSGVPYSPVIGPRILANSDYNSDEAGQFLIDKLAAHCAAEKYSSWHINFLNEIDRQNFLASKQDFLIRYNWQFHWPNRKYSTFEDFLGTLKRRKRNNIKRERARVRDAGISIQCLDGDELSDSQLEFVIQCYRDTFLMKGNYPALTADFFHQLRSGMAKQFLVTLAYRGTSPLAAAIFMRDKSTLYGRYWGSIENIPDLHFELCYYQGIEYCIQHGLHVFQPGAGGEYKIARGFLPVKTYSAHFIRQPEFHRAIREFINEEDRWLKHYYLDVVAHSPYQPSPIEQDLDDTETA